MKEFFFGPYRIEVSENHAVIFNSMEVNGPVQPTFYELQHIKCLAFGGRATAIEIFPDVRDLIDRKNQRHLWKVDPGLVPNLNKGD